MSENQASYRQIMKATSLFGGVQVFNILISIIRSKFIAVLLGPAGMGFAGLLSSTTGIISSLTNFGLGTSAVKDIAAAHGTGNYTRIAIVASVLRRLVWITGCLGMITMLVLSPWLSQLTFGNKKYTLAFIWLSISLLLSQLSSGQYILLQGMRKLQYLAKANMIGTFLGLFTTIPLYYIFGIDGIVPSMILSSLISLLIGVFFTNKIKLDKIKVSHIRTLAEGKNMLSLGFILSINGIFSAGMSYIFTIFITKTGGIAQLGLYNAGFSFIGNYVGLIFSAMATDYYPRLAAVAHSNHLCKKTINQQTEIAILIMAPMIMAFIVFIQWTILILYSKKFIAIDVMIHWVALGMLFKATSWAIAFIFLAKGDSKVFLLNEVAANIYMLFLNILGYQFMGLSGLGLSFLIGYLIYAIQVFLLSKIKYQFSFDSELIKIFGIQFLLTLSCFIVVKFFDNPFSYGIGLIFIIISIWYSLKEMDKRLSIKTLILNIKSKYIK